MLFDIVRVPLPLRVRFPSSTSSVKFPDEFRFKFPLLAMLPEASRTSPFRMFRVSPELLRVRVPNIPPLTFMFTLAEAVPMVTASEPVGTPLVQFPAVPQSLSPALPVHESAVSGGSVAVRVARLATGCGLNHDCRERVCFRPRAACAVARPRKLETDASRQRAVIQGVNRRGDRGRMADSRREICVLSEPVRDTM